MSPCYDTPKRTLDIAVGLANDVREAYGSRLNMNDFYVAAAVMDPDATEDEIDNAYIVYAAICDHDEDRDQ